jgi:hypothetical protein
MLVMSGPKNTVEIATEDPSRSTKGARSTKNKKPNMKNARKAHTNYFISIFLVLSKLPKKNKRMLGFQV